MKNIRKSGFTLVELLIVLAIIVVIFGVVVSCGWGVAFAFSAKVLVPWLGIPVAWAHAATLLLSFALTGVSTVIILVVIALFLLVCNAICKAFSRSKR